MIATSNPLIDDFKVHYDSNNGNFLSPSKREEAWNAFVSAGLPNKRTEEYKYIPITRLLEKNVDVTKDLKSSPSSLESDEIRKHFIKGATGFRIVLVNGHLNESLSDFPEGIKLKHIDEVSNEDLKSKIGTIAKAENDPFLALNTAIAADGFVFQIEKSVVLEKPLYIYNLTDTTSETIHHHPRNLVVLGENSQAKVIMVNKGFGENAAFINEVNEIFLGQNAQLEWIRLEDEPEKCYHINNTQIYQEKDAHFSATTLLLAGGLLRNNLQTMLDGEGCESNLYGLYMIGDKSIVDNHTVVDHMKPNSNSNELYKGILFDEAKGVFNGKIYVRQDAQNTNAFQSNNNILLSPKAVINTKPQLEIWADDVKCTHGCTSGQLDEDAVFYLRARGINKDKAKALLLQAFAYEVIDNITLTEVKEYMEDYVDQKLGL